MLISDLSHLPITPAGKTSWPWTEEAPQFPLTMPDGSPWPMISIVTPSYNQGQFIEETIRSVLLQGYPNLEYIIIDGGSNDSSVEIIKKYEPWLAYWVCEPDRGQSHAINKGFRKATGELLAWINSDDLYTKGALIRIAQTWKETGYPGLVHGMTEYIDDHGSRIGRQFGSGFDLQETLLSSVNTVAQPSTFISKHALKETGLLDEEISMSMDWDLWIRIAEKHPVVFSFQIWSEFRMWSGSKTLTNNIGKESEHVRIVRKLFKDKRASSISRTVKRGALAAAYRMLALAHFRDANYGEFRKHLLLSLVYAPNFTDKKIQSLLPSVIFGVEPAHKLISLKKMIFRR